MSNSLKGKEEKIKFSFYFIRTKISRSTGKYTGVAGYKGMNLRAFMKEIDKDVSYLPVHRINIKYVKIIMKEMKEEGQKEGC